MSDITPPFFAQLKFVATPACEQAVQLPFCDHGDFDLQLPW
jgi:hypothetical protein